MTTATTLITAEEFAELAAQLDGLCELVRGEVREMTRPTPRHGGVCANVTGEIWTWARASRRGRVISNDAGVVTERDPDTVRGPDVYFIREDRLPEGVWPAAWLEIPPDLCVEVLSPTDRWKLVLEKVSEYLDFGVPEVWVVDPDRKQVHVYQSDLAPIVLKPGDELRSDQLPGFACAVSALFEGC